MGLVVTGLLNKQVGFELGISEITVKAHRGSGYAQDEGPFASRTSQHGCKAGA
jgi:FixJ family two-component response regulator